jgi:hypothetical protein
MIALIGFILILIGGVLSIMQPPAKSSVPLIVIGVVTVLIWCFK